ncbi:MAG: hypothetical protein PHY26_00705 [Bacilli bacterium]|jgi:hypothetical protein|nr:hypothetical protein [Bacilli bacterium]
MLGYIFTIILVIITLILYKKNTNFPKCGDCNNCNIHNCEKRDIK